MTLSRHAWLLALVLAACAPRTAQWEKPGATAATANEAVEQCRVAARFSPVPASALRPPPTTAGTGALTREEELAALETAEFQRCMRERGYSARR